MTLRTLALAGVAGLALLGVAAAPAVAAPAHPAAPPATTAVADPAAVLTASQIRFFTNDDDKDGDTGLGVQVLTPGGGIAALANPAGTFPNDTTNGPFPLQVNPGFTAGQLNGGSLRLAVTPVGNDTWRFSLRLDLTFSDGTTVPVRADNLTLSESSRTLSVPMTTVGLVAVPNLFNLKPGAARTRLGAVGLVPGNQTNEVDPTCAHNRTVKDQSPDAGTLVPTGTAVDITVGLLPDGGCP